MYTGSDTFRRCVDECKAAHMKKIIITVKTLRAAQLQVVRTTTYIYIYIKNLVYRIEMQFYA